MSLVRMNFQSKYLGNFTNINILLPDRPRAADPREFYSQGKKYKTVWLLHGTGGDCNEWLNMSRIMMYASERDLIVVMVSAMNSNYVNWPKFGMGYNWYDFLTEELMPMVYGWYPASDKREDNFIAGLSMGGRGTLTTAFNHPELFAGAAVLSACPVEYTPEGLTDEALSKGGFMGERTKLILENAGGVEGFLSGPENIWEIAPRLIKEGVELPRFYFSTGGDDKRVVENYKTWIPYSESIGLDAKYEIIPGYAHEWRFWDLAIQNAFDYFGLPIVNAFAI